MGTCNMMRLSCAFLFAVLTASATAASAASPALDSTAIGKAAGTDVTTTPDGVVHLAWARRDVAVKVDGAPLDPAAGLGSWAAFLPMDHGSMVMGDTVLFQDEVDAAMDAAFAHGFDVTALHNHFMYDAPRVFFMHIEGHGDAGTLAAGVRAVWDAIKAVRAKNPIPVEGFPGAAPQSGKLDADAISKIVGHPAQAAGDVLKVTIGREGNMHGTVIPASMGLTTWAAFSGSDTAATVDGDFIMTAADITPVLKALRAHGIHVVALHNHMTSGEPFFFFTHYWGKGPAKDLAQGFRAALDAQDATKAK
jgi:hypothetical protein